MLLNKKGAALLQVLIVTAILAGLSAMVLRLSLARTITARKARHVVNAQMVIESCMAEVNAIWAAKKPEVYAHDLAECQMCNPNDMLNSEDAKCSSDNRTIHTCAIALSSGANFRVQAKMEKKEEAGAPPCTITYTVVNANNTARQAL